MNDDVCGVPNPTTGRPCNLDEEEHWRGHEWEIQPAPTPETPTRCIGCGCDFYPPNGTELCPHCCPKEER